jgi:hypothetical protein
MLTSQASHRARDLGRLYQGRQRGHAPQISISDDNHHVTDAIGSMYGDEEDYQEERQQQPQRPKPSRPLSFAPSPLGDTIQPNNALSIDPRSYNARPGVLRTPSHEKRGPILGQRGSPNSYYGAQSSTSPPEYAGSRGGVNGHSPTHGNGNGTASPTSMNHSPSEASQHFPLTDLDSSAAVAQELSNLQAIRRMSMDVHAADPDLPSFNPGYNVPAVAPSHDADEQDPARMFWVPASVHPELAPQAFESFIQDRVKTIKRSSLSLGSEPVPSSLSPASAEGGSLRRKKSMLSRQVNDSSGYQDGAERLERKRSSVIHENGLPGLQELEDLAQDASSLARRLSIDGSRNSLEAAPDAAEGQDMPILPPKPLGQGLKRSTKTTYRRGSQRKGDRLVGRRGVRGAHESDHDEPPVPSLPKADGIPQLPAFSPDLGRVDEGFGGLQRVQTEPTPPKPQAVSNFSRPGRKAQTPPISQDEGFGYSDARPTSPEDRQKSPSPESHMYPPRGSSARSPPPVQQMQVPTIVETPPPAQDNGRPYSAPNMHRPERVSSMDQPPSQPPQTPLPNRPSRPTLNRPESLQQSRERVQPQQKTTFDQMGVNQQPLPIQSTRTDNLSIIPTYDAADKKSEKKGKDKTDDGTRKSSWSWLTGEKDKEKEKESGKKSKQKLQRPVERHNDTRLDVLQTQIDGGKPRESLVLDRSAIQVEQPKQAGRKASGDGKKEKDTGLFSSLFGGGKKKGDKDHSGSKKGPSLRGLSPEPPQRRLQPDIDYNWSRFSILEERAIYRMAHIKLANPRRELYSQVLLSNFMYSYLAKVQQMHPQIQIPQSAAQKKQAAQAKKAEQQAAAANQAAQGQQGGGSGQQPEEFSQYQRYQEVS